MGFAISRNFPVLEMIWSNSPIALFWTRTDQAKLIKIRPILDKYFVCPWGFFRLPGRVGGIFKQAFHIYSGANYVALDVHALKEIEMHLALKDEAVLQKYIEDKIAEQEDEDLERLVNDPEHGMRPDLVDKMLNPQFDPNQTGELTADEQPEAQSEERPEKPPQIKRMLRMMREPVNMHVERYLSNDYEHLDPEGLRVGIDEVTKGDKMLNSMSSPSLKALLPMGIIVGGGIVAYLILTNINNIATQFGDLFSGLPGL